MKSKSIEFNSKSNQSILSLNQSSKKIICKRVAEALGDVHNLRIASKCYLPHTASARTQPSLVAPASFSPSFSPSAVQIGQPVSEAQFVAQQRQVI